MPANDSEAPKPPAAPAEESARGGAPHQGEFFADLNGRDEHAARPPVRRGASPQIDFREVRQGTLPGNKYIRVLRAQDQVLKQVTPDYLVAGEQLSTPHGPFGKLRRALVGRPIASEQAIHERLTNVKALAIFSSDALSSVAYATEAILGVLILAGGAAFGYTIPIAIAIAVLLAIVGVSYRQTIQAYPNGASAYLVAKANLGTLPSLTAGASLLIDYTLTVAVSVSAGVAAITSALPSLHPWRVEICVAFVGLIILGNLRGIRESGSIFAVPTYLFILSIAVLVFLGVFRSLTGGDVPVNAPRDVVNTTEGVSLFLILRAFTAGCTALTGVEAISDGVPAFKPPEAKNAAKTLTWMCAILGAMFIGLSFLAHRYGIVPNPQETVVSQIARTIIGHNFFYYFIQAMTALILILAANTSFADFPRLSTWLAKDHFMPKQFLFRGDRLAFNTGIAVLGILATILLVAFGGQTDRLLPLYAVGVFTAFTLSQAGMVLHWYKERGRGWTRRFALNLVGATATGFVLVLVIATKLLLGAWIVLLLMPLLILLFRTINRHYTSAAAEVALTDDDVPGVSLQREQVVIVPIAEINKTTVNALNYARTLSPKVVGVHVTDDAEEAAHLQEKWEKWGEGVNLVILESPYRSLMGPLLSYIDIVQKKRPKAMITVLVPEYIPAHWWQQILHSQTALRMKAALLLRPNTVVTSVPYQSKNVRTPRNRR
ncbi:MAG: APC family permease [Thermomicrobiales bacterium]